jgi:transposase
VSMTNSTNRVEIITSVQRRRRWTAPEKVRMVEETFEPGMTVSLVARRHGVAPNQLFTWRRLVAQGSLTAADSGEEVVPASDYRALQNQVRELHRLLGKKTLEAEIERSRCRATEVCCRGGSPSASLSMAGNRPRQLDKR